MAQFSIWEGDLCGCCLKRGMDPPAFVNGTPEDPGAVKVAEFEALSWNEACQRYNDHYGFGRYESHGNWEEIPVGEA